MQRSGFCKDDAIEAMDSEEVLEAMIVFSDT